MRISQVSRTFEKLMTKSGKTGQVGGGGGGGGGGVKLHILIGLQTGM